jgi:REP element-mobilizing transposase RayT
MPPACPVDRYAGVQRWGVQLAIRPTAWKMQSMLMLPYTLDELQFAWCYRIYLRFGTYRRRSYSVLAEVGLDVLNEIGARYNIEVLEHRAGERDVLLLLSLKPDESVAACTSKLKGQVSKWLRQRIPTDDKLLSRGYFACSTGKSRTEVVEQYLSRQGDHHGYADRVKPPIFVRRFELSNAEEDLVRAEHAATLLQHHVVLATWWRKGVFGASAAQVNAESWQTVCRQQRAALMKVSFVPDHVHLAVRVHPSVSPNVLTLALMNAAQELMWTHFDHDVIQAGTPRLWQPSAYLGSYGDLASPQISAYLRNWEHQSADD